MPNTRPIRRIAIIGTGVIGASWTAQFLAKGLDVIATDVAPDAEASLRRFVAAAWPALERLGLAPGASQTRLTFTTDLTAAVRTADLVQENGPERIDFKKKLYRQLDELLPADVIIASSSSGLTMSEIQSDCPLHPERCVIGHPFNPPHIIPLVEVVGGAETSPAALEQAMKFYASIGKKPILLRKEMPGHVANRLQLALYREVLYLIEQDVLGVADADDAVSWGPGLRWGVMGPNLQFHLAGGSGGIQHFLEGVFAGLAPVFKSLGDPSINAELKQKIAQGVLKEAGPRSVDQLAEKENEVLVGLLGLRAQHA